MMKTYRRREDVFRVRGRQCGVRTQGGTEGGGTGGLRRRQRQENRSEDRDGQTQPRHGRRLARLSETAVGESPLDWGLRGVGEPPASASPGRGATPARAGRAHRLRE